MSYQDFPPSRAPPTAPYILTREEKRVLQDCNSESFYRRCVPFMTVLGLGAYYGVHLGYLKKNINYGAAPKVAVGLVVGFIAGKLSYQERCEEKILHLPGGKLKEAVLASRSKRDGVWKFDDGGVYKDASISYALPPYAERSFSSYDQQPNASSEMDFERPMDSFDDSFRTRSEFADDAEHALQVPPSTSVTYDELRGRNRAEFESRRKPYRTGPAEYSPYSGSYTSQPPPPRSEFDDRPAADRYEPYRDNEPAYPPAPSRPSPYRDYEPSYPSAPSRSPPQRQNFYGDVIEK